MKSYKITLWVTVTLTVMAFVFMLLLEWHIDLIVIKVLSGHREFIISVLTGIFTGGLVAIISLSVFYFLLKEKTKAKVKYELQQLRGEIKTFQLYQELTSSKPIEEKNIDVIIKAYQGIDELTAVFIELSLDEVKTIYGNELFDIIINMKTIINQLGMDLFKSPSKTNELIKTFSKDINPYIKKIEEFYTSI
jgi:hypothetical protein